MSNSSNLKDFIELLKPRVMSLVVFTSLCGMLLAISQTPDNINIIIAILAIICISLGSGASGAINMWYDRDIDAIMERTKKRPIPSGRVDENEALSFGAILGVTSVVLLFLATNYVAALLLLAAIAFYIFIYTAWLKRTSTQNIVIGGAAGSLPPMIGWAAVTGDITTQSVVMFLMIFLWTPPHFWALAIAIKDEYSKVDVPMLPCVKGDAATAKQILIYTAIVVLFSYLPLWLGFASWLYLGAVSILNFGFLYLAIGLYKKQNKKQAMATFGFSILYLFGQFLALVIDSFLVL